MANIPSGVVPNHPGQFSAFGFIMTDPRIDVERTTPMTLEGVQARSRQPRHERSSPEESTRGPDANRATPSRIEIHPLRWKCAISARITNSRLPSTSTNSPTRPSLRCGTVFMPPIRRATISTSPGKPSRLISIKITAIAQTTGTPILPSLAAGSGSARPDRHAHRGVRRWRARRGRLPDRASLLGGQRFTGPAVIEEPASVTVVRPGMPVRVDGYGNLLLGEIALLLGEIAES